MGSLALKEVLNEYQGKILPQNHPLSIHVRKVARKIITASDLGYVKGDDEPSFGMHDNPFSAPSHSSMSPQKEWNVIVVNDKTFVNAFASPGVV
jgi:metalloendopeptidase OMA1, mitochondrial